MISCAVVVATRASGGLKPSLVTVSSFGVVGSSVRYVMNQGMFKHAYKATIHVGMATAWQKSGGTTRVKYPTLIPENPIA